MGLLYCFVFDISISRFNSANVNFSEFMARIIKCIYTITGCCDTMQLTQGNEHFSGGSSYGGLGAPHWPKFRAGHSGSKQSASDKGANFH